MPWNGAPAEPLRHFSGTVRVASPTRPAGTASRSRQRPCKYGPRDADGYCPKKPSTARARSGGRPCKYGPRGADGYCPKKPSAGRRTTSSSSRTTSAGPKPPTAAERRRQEAAITEAATAAAQIGGQAYINRAAIARVARSPLSALPRAGVIGGAIAVGLAAFLATTAGLKKIRNKRKKREQEQYLAARAYRLARLNAIEQFGRPLRAEEHDLLAAEWRDKLPRARY